MLCTDRRPSHGLGRGLARTSGDVDNGHACYA